MNCFGQPLFYGIVLMLGPEFFHLLSCSLRDESWILNLLPEGWLVEVRCVIWTHDLEKLNSLNYSELFLLADIKFFARDVVAFWQFVVILLCNHFGSSNLHWITFISIDRVSDPVADVDRPLVKIFHLKLCVLWLYLVGETLVLVDHYSSVLVNEMFQIIKVLTTFGNIKHYNQQIKKKTGTYS